jgi:drug/metabolite transporter (DMT)-like permease
MNKKKIALFCAFIATTIYGLNHTIAKEIMPKYIEAFGLVQLRLLGAGIAFWILSLFIPNEKIQKNDIKKIILASFFGMSFNMLMFIKGLSLSTPINSGILVTLTPVIILILSAILLNEKITILKFTGIIFGFLGAIILILNGGEFIKNAPNISLGNSLLLLNSLSYGTYLVIIKPLINKYSIITLMKWMFLIGLIISMPFTFSEFLSVNWKLLPFKAIWRMIFVVLGTTFLTYLLNSFALKNIKPTTIGAFVYLQPIIAILYSSITGNDKLDSIKILACILIFSGIYLITKKQMSSIK